MEAARENLLSEILAYLDPVAVVEPIPEPEIKPDIVPEQEDVKPETKLGIETPADTKPTQGCIPGLLSGLFK